MAFAARAWVTATVGIAVLSPTFLSAQVFGCSTHDINTLLNDDTVEKALNDAFQKSGVGTDDFHEEGGSIYDCLGPNGWEIKIVEFPPGTQSSIPFGEPLDDPNCVLVGWYHTHPGPESDHPSNNGYRNEQPSETDEEVSEDLGIPGLMVYGPPGLPQTVPFGPDEPRSSCAGEDEPAQSWGEPHLLTLDGLAYDFQRPGEFVLVRSTTVDLEIQVRQEPVTDNVSSNTAFAVGIGGSVFEYDVPDRVVIDGDERAFSDFTNLDLPDGSRVTRDGGTLTFVWADQSTAVILGGSVSVLPASARGGTVEGLLGNFDDDADNDLVDAGGALLLDDGRLTFEEVNTVLADAWRVTEETTLFTYEPGTSLETFANVTEPRYRLGIDDVDPALAEVAARQCRAAGLEEETDRRRFANCVFDVALTGDSEYAIEAAGLADAFEPEFELSPLLEAVKARLADEITRLLAEGAELDAVDDGGRTALQWAILQGDLELVQQLLDAGADHRVADERGTTPLHRAAFWGQEDIVEVLIAAGADPTAQDDQGRTPADLAREQGREEVLEFLEG